jgi:hypothetical protein
VALATSSVPNVPVTGGIASTPVPVDPAAFNGQTRYLGICINGGAELTPRVLVTAVPYAMSAEKLRESVFLATNGSVGVGTANPTAIFEVEGGGSSVADFLKVSGPEASPILRIFDDSPKSDATEVFGVFRDGLTRIGTDDHPGSLEVHGPTTVSGLTATRLGIRASADYEAVELEGGFGAPVLDISKVGGSLNSPIVRVFRDAPKADSTLAFTIIRDEGRVGIGVPIPATKLEVDGTTRTTVLQITSARAAKAGFAPVDAAAVLAKVAALPLATWAYTNSPGVRHVGPVAEDFHAAFALGDSAQHIATVDADGVALAAIQGLHQLVTAQQTALRARASEVHALQERLEKLERLVTELAGQRKEEGK